MGDRAVIVIEKDNSGLFPHEIYFYTHWRGSEIKEILQDALKRGKERWDDGSYLARIIFCSLIGDKKDTTTGFGISTAIVDSEYRLLCVNMEEGVVRIRNSKISLDSEVIQTWTFAEYVAQNFYTTSQCN